MKEMKEMLRKVRRMRVRVRKAKRIHLLLYVLSMEREKKDD